MGALALSILVCLLVLYVPGFFVASSFCIPRFSAFVAAPAFSLLLAVLIGIFFSAIGVTCSPLALFVTTCLFSVCLFAVSRFFLLRRPRNRDALHVEKSTEDSFSILKRAALYVFIASVIVCIVFGGALDGADSFARNDDTNVHLSVIRGFLDTGTFSTLNVSQYLNIGAQGVFYPASFHVATSIVAFIFGGNVALAYNAMTICFTAAVFPLTICLLFHSLFPESKIALTVGALFPVSFGAFPWGFIVFGQLLPNMLAFMFVPIAFVFATEAMKSTSSTSRFRYAILCLLAVFSISLTQPNAVFTFGIWIVLYAISQCFFSESMQSIAMKKKALYALALIIVAGVAWVLIYKAPFMAGVVSFHWDAYFSLREGIIRALLFAFEDREGPQVILSIIVFAGVLYTMKNRQYLWLSVAFCLALIMYLVDVAYDGPGKHFLTGFWYTDSYRTSAMAALFAIPLATLGAAAILDGISNIVAVRLGNDNNTAQISWVAGILLVCVLFISNFLPVYLPSFGASGSYLGLIQVQDQIAIRYSWKEGLTSEEQAFIANMKELIPEESLVVNVPRDGSCWAYGVDGLNTYYRRTYASGAGEEKENNLLQKELCNIATSSDVQTVVDKYDLRYVLILDDLSSESPTTFEMLYKPDDWIGIESITEATPGFSLVASEGDMRLYAID